MDYGGGLQDQPMGKVDRVTTLMVVYEAWRGFSRAGNRLIDWAESNPSHMKVIIMVQKMRTEMEQ